MRDNPFLDGEYTIPLPEAARFRPLPASAFTPWHTPFILF